MYGRFRWGPIFVTRMETAVNLFLLTLPKRQPLSQGSGLSLSLLGRELMLRQTIAINTSMNCNEVPFDQSFTRAHAATLYIVGCL